MYGKYEVNYSMNNMKNEMWKWFTPFKVEIKLFLCSERVHEGR